MNTLDMPGFTADAALYITRKQYSVTASYYRQNHQLGRPSPVQGNVVPQMKIHWSNYCTSGCSFWD